MAGSGGEVQHPTILGLGLGLGGLGGELRVRLRLGLRLGSRLGLGLGLGLVSWVVNFSTSALYIFQNIAYICTELLEYK